MRRGEIGPMMYIVLAILVLLAVAVLILRLSGRSWGILDMIRSALP